MTQKEINEVAWKNPENWKGPDWRAIYVSKKDTRSWVRKKIPWMGWTLNLGRTSGVCWLIGIFIIILNIFIIGGMLVTGFTM